MMVKFVTLPNPNMLTLEKKTFLLNSFLTSHMKFPCDSRFMCFMVTVLMSSAIAILESLLANSLPFLYQYITAGG